MNFTKEFFKILLKPNRLISVLGIFKDWANGYFDAQASVDPEKAFIIESKIDDRIKIKDESIYSYLFAFVYILYSSLYLITLFKKKDYIKAKNSIKSLIDKSHEIFINFPTKMKPRTRSNHILLKYAQSIDGETNCCPSLHVSLTNITYFILSNQNDIEDNLIKTMRQCCIDISRSTLETKQHSIIDVISGIYIAKEEYMKFGGIEYENLINEIIPELNKNEISFINEKMKINNLNIQNLSMDLLNFFNNN
jgi:hypothetical protein